MGWVSDFSFRKGDNLRTCEATSPLRDSPILRECSGNEQNDSSPGDHKTLLDGSSGGQDQGYFREPSEKSIKSSWLLTTKPRERLV